MREILFRGKTSDGEWVEGFYSAEEYNPYIGKIEYIPRIQIIGKCVSLGVIPETVGQYTGLTDKNGVRIFEGDIVSLVKHDSLIYKVVYVPCRYELVNSKGVNCFVLDIYKSENIEVIGNIHDNPELLGGENNGINR